MRKEKSVKIYNTNASLVVKDRDQMKNIHPHVRMDTIGFLSATEIALNFSAIKWQGHYLDKNLEKLQSEDLYRALSRPMHNTKSNRGYFEIVIEMGEIVIIHGHSVLTKALVTIHQFKKHPADK